jgi:hypothetical protein
MGQECLYFGGAHFGRVAHVVEKDVAFDPANVGLLGANGLVLEADGVADLVQQFLGASLLHRLPPSI